jgi:UDP-N-acetyl-2-amino-2-deoxyglucuronate dehydrogenase
VAGQYAVLAFQDINSLLSAAVADVIVLCTPSGLHAQQTIQIAKQGVHVITEKPMATRLADAQQMLQSCHEANVRLFVVKQNRYQPTLQLLKQAIENNRFGRLYLVNINVFWTRPQSYYDQAKWRGTWEFDGGALMNQASHYVDLLDWLIGPVQSVQAMMATLGRQIEVEDTAVVNIRWRSGAIGSMNVTMLTYPKNLEASLSILGEKGTVKIGGTGANEIQHWEFADSKPEDTLLQEITIATKAQQNAGHIPYYKNVIQTLQGKAEPMIDGREGLKSLEILTAMYLSARDNKNISLPLML